MPPLVPFENGFDAIDGSANEDNFDDFISATLHSGSEYDTTKDSILFSQKHLNDLIRDLCLSEEKAKLIASRLKERNMIEKNVKVS